MQSGWPDIIRCGAYIFFKSSNYRYDSFDFGKIKFLNFNNSNQRFIKYISFFIIAKYNNKQFSNFPK